MLRLHIDGTIAIRIALDDPLQTLVEMRADPAAAGVFVAGHRTDPSNPQAARARIQRLRADGSVDWLWQSSTSALASSIKYLRVSASAGIFAIGSRFRPDGTGQTAQDWLAAGLSLAGVPRFDKKISFDNAVDVVGSSAVDAAGLWLVAQRGQLSDGAPNGKVSVVRLSANGNLGDSHQISGAQFGTSGTLALRRDGGLWLLVFGETFSIVGVDGQGRERARLAGVFSSKALGLLPDDRALGVTGSGLLKPISAVRIGFGQSAEPWSQLAMPGRPSAPIEAVASDGAVAQWLTLPGPFGGLISSALTFRNSDTAPVAWRIEFAFFGNIQLSVSRSQVCLAGWGADVTSIHYVLECRRRADGSLLWQDARPPQPGGGIERFQAVTALDDGRAVAINSGYGSLHQWLIGADGQILSEKTLPLLGAAQQELLINDAAFNAQGDALLVSFGRTRQSGTLLRLDSDGRGHFQVAVTTGDIASEQIAFTDDGGAVQYSNRRSVFARYSVSGEKLWERMPDRPIADLVVDGDTIMFSDGGVVVALDSASGSERWRLPLNVQDRWSAGIAALVPQRLAVLQTEGNHLRYRELDVVSGTVLREQTDVCAGESCSCEQNSCLPLRRAEPVDLRPALPLQWVGGRLRTRVGNLQADADWGSSVLELNDAGLDPATVRADQEGVSGAFFAPWSSGQGLVIEWIAGARTLFAPWFTFRPEGGNDPSGLRWYTLQATLAGPSPDATLDILSSEGGRFGAGITSPRRVGSARLQFESCDRVQFGYQFDPDENDGQSGLVTLSRLTPGAACQNSTAAASTAATPKSFDASVDGAWFDPASSGQGLMFNAIPAADTLFATWFTYDTEAAPDDPRQQHWFTLQGPLGSGEQTTLAIIRTIGGALIDQPTGNTQRVGTATVTRLGCDRLRLDYLFDDSETAGPFRRIGDSQDLQRIGGCAQ